MTWDLIGRLGRFRGVQWAAIGIGRERMTVDLRLKGARGQAIGLNADDSQVKVISVGAG